MEYAQIGQRIKSRRKELDISAVDLAARLSMSKATIHRYENGDIKNIKVPVIESIAKELSVNPLWIIGKSEDMQVKKRCEDDLLFKIDEMIDYVCKTANLTANGVLLSKEERRIVLTGLGFTRDYVSKIK